MADYDERYRFEVTVTTGDPSLPDSFAASTATDGAVPFERLGAVVLPTPDGEVRLDLWRLATLRRRALPARQGPRPGSYGGGRYVLDTIKGADLGTSRRTTAHRPWWST